MTPRDAPDDRDPAVRLLRETLRERASTADTPLARRSPDRGTSPLRAWLPAVAAAAVAILAVGGVAAWRADQPTPPAVASTPSPAPSTAVPQGWEPVASLGIEIHVPGTWRVTGAVNSCTLTDPAAGTVSRPLGAITAQGCFKPPRGTLISFQHTMRKPPTAGRVTEDGHTTITWVSPDRTAAVMASGTDTALLQRVIDTARVVEVDSLGCTTTPPRLAWDRPRTGLPPVRLASDVIEVVGCAYAVHGGSDDDPEYRLVASRTFDAADRAALATALRRAPAGAAPDVPQNCAPDLVETEYVVLHVRDAVATTPLALHSVNCLDRYVAGPRAQSAVTVRLVTTVMEAIQVGFGYNQLPQG